MASDEQLYSPNPPSAPYFPLATRTGFFIAAIIVGFGLITYLMGLNEMMMTNTTAKMVNNLITFLMPIIFIFYTCKQHRDRDLGGFIGIGRCLGLGTMGGIVAGLIIGIWSYAFLKFISPETMDLIKQMAIQEAVKSGQSADMAEEGIEKASFMFKPLLFAVISLFTYIFLGFIGGLIGGLFLKKERSYM
jgi:Protein of unknown function (DUF4199)